MATPTTTPGGVVLAIGGVVLAGCALLALCARFLERGRALPKTGTGTLSFRGRRRFGGLIAPEIVGWTVLDVTPGRHHQAVWIVPADLLPTGTHFIPPAFVFRVRAYLAVGIPWLLAVAGSLLLWPSITVIGHASAWDTVPSLFRIAITWPTVLFVLTSEMTRLRGPGPPR